jgi:hypothetical protein
MRSIHRATVRPPFKNDEILREIKKVVESGTLPDGDHPNQPTLMWLESLIEGKK